MNGQFICVTATPEICTGDDCPITTPTPCTGDDCETAPTPTPCTGDDCETTPTPTPCTGDNCETTPTPTPCTGDDCETKEGFCDIEGNCSTTVTTNKKPSDGLKGFWVSEYPDGVEGMFSGKVDELKSTEFYTFLQEFQPEIGVGRPPSFALCFNFGNFGNYGCKEISIDPRVFPALKVFILISAGFGCRRILFGG
jgi:hypothetical protein